ncbi:carboxymuconolactone decarboxylase family protein [Sutterella sp.]|uniref:carboxymuconolactone decarboxylase family protein n=1 Tax=Sutterella sp. TaxID=1981025 RepID=UPI0026DEF026|nr:carboxymuconolactone decarboxylase family protein [Sutterella sp.]MDO5532716.1 carboxymuconolactone decarboxylase family protein [Sutterella sp.]
MPTPFATRYHERMFPGYVSDFPRTDPEFIERFDNFAFDDVVRTVKLDEPRRFRVILALLLGCSGIDEFRAVLPAALEMGVTPVEVKEIVYQAVGYLGIGRVYPFLKAVNTILAERGVELPLAAQNRGPAEERARTGEETLVGIFGDSMKGFAGSGPAKTRHIRRWLTENCFGDWCSRGGLDARERELMTFCFLLAQGGCEAQLESHVAANLRVGNDEDTLIAAASQAVPFVGYPRALNGLAVIERVTSRAD